MKLFYASTVFEDLSNIPVDLYTFTNPRNVRPGPDTPTPTRKIHSPLWLGLLVVFKGYHGWAVMNRF